ncbi:toll/interleukin-1 receptor domain-containing protein [Rhodococcus erythropolis]|nr:toll/interleukin-1 receptor domain-containing protein [Rhodococcus erythropolis]
MQQGTGVFISWSGDLTKAIAKEVATQLNFLFDSVVPWYSEDDIQLGTQNMKSIFTQLQESSAGIFILTRENQRETWVNFEAGAMSMTVGVDERRVIPLLVDMKPKDLEGPLRNFQGKTFDRDGWRKVVSALAELAGVKNETAMTRLAISEDKFFNKLDEIKRGFPAVAEEPVSPEGEKYDKVLQRVEESLEATRDLGRDFRDAGQAVRKESVEQTLAAIARKVLDDNDAQVCLRHFDGCGVSDDEAVLFLATDRLHGDKEINAIMEYARGFGVDRIAVFNEADELFDWV